MVIGPAVGVRSSQRGLRPFDTGKRVSFYRDKSKGRFMRLLSINLSDLIKPIFWHRWTLKVVRLIVNK